MSTNREGGLEAPTRHPLGWQEESFWDEEALNQELERVFDICHGCRRCVSLCQSFPTLFDLVDESSTMELDGVDKKDYINVVDQCYLCDLCYQTKCPYVPPHEFNLDYPHLMLRAKAIKFRKGETRTRDKLLTSTMGMGKMASAPVVVKVVNAANRSEGMRKVTEKVLGVHHKAPVPEFVRPTLKKRAKGIAPLAAPPQAAGRTRGKVAVFGTCYGHYIEPGAAEDLINVFQHNGIATTLVAGEACCGMPKLELGDLDTVAQYKNQNIPILVKAIDEGWDIVAPIPSCVLMFKQELPLMFPDDEAVQKVKAHIFDPFEYLMIRHKAELMNTQFTARLGKVLYHVPCHQRVQNIGPKTKDVLALVPDTTLEVVERCSGHDGTYAVKSEYYADAVKIVRPVVRKAKKAEPDYISSDCPMAARQIAHNMEGAPRTQHPISLLALAYGIK